MVTINIRLKKQNIDSHQIDAELLLSKAIGKDRVFLLTNDENRISIDFELNTINYRLTIKN